MDQVPGGIEMEPSTPEGRALKAAEVRNGNNNDPLRRQQPREMFQHLGWPSHVLQDVPERNDVEQPEFALDLLERRLNQLQPLGGNRRTEAEWLDPDSVEPGAAHVPRERPVSTSEIQQPSRPLDLPDECFALAQEEAQRPRDGFAGVAVRLVEDGVQLVARRSQAVVGENQRATDAAQNRVAVAGA
jgi:hypothetical protein